MTPIIRVSILRFPPGKRDALAAMMREAEAVLRPGIEAMAGLIAFYAGEDAATSSMTNTSLWDTLEHARQLDAFQPMLDLGAAFAAEGASLERPVMNYATSWRFGPGTTS